MAFHPLLRNVPSIDEWASTVPPETLHRLLESGAIEYAYHQHYAVQIPAFDRDGMAATPPDEHVLDAFARRCVPGIETLAHERAEFGTVAIVPETTPCELCVWGSARYETPVGRDRDIVAACVPCTNHHGDPFLGPSHSVMLMQSGELPARVLRQVLPFVDPDARDSWGPRYRGDHWDSYRRWGFVGPDEQGLFYAVIAGVSLQLQWGQYDWLELTRRHAGLRKMFAPGGETGLLPRGLDELDARSALIDALHSARDGSSYRQSLDQHFEVAADERDSRALSGMERDPFVEWLRLTPDTPLCRSADAAMAALSAERGTNVDVLDELAARHPEPEVRRQAIANRSLPRESLERIAARRDECVSHTLLMRPDLPVDSVRTVVETLQLAGVMDHWAMYEALVRPDFPDNSLRSVVTRIAADGTDSRIALAECMHRAPPARRDTVHLQLLAAARRIKSTHALVNAVVGEVPGRREWIWEQPDLRFRSLLAWHEFDGHAIDMHSGTGEPSSTPDA
ncbi:MAG: hypothetical protein WA966_09435 [Ornithinimicrobium sp.]